MINKRAICFLSVLLFCLPLIVWGQPRSVRNKPVALVADTLAQKSQKTDTARNVIYLELLGNSVLCSFNYERMIGESFSVRFGALFSGTVMVNYFVGSGSHKLELGAGLTYLESLGMTLTFGYRYQPLDGGFVFKAGLTPFIGTIPSFGLGGNSTGSKGFHPWIGLSFGHCF